MEDKRLFLLVQEQGESLSHEIIELRAEITESKKIITLERQEIEEEKQLLHKFESKIKEFEKFQTPETDSEKAGYPLSEFENNVTINLLEQTIKSREKKYETSTFITQKLKLDEIASEYKQALEISSENLSELERLKTDRNTVLQEILGNESFNEYLLFERINTDESVRFEALQQQEAVLTAELSNLKALLESEIQELAISKEFIERCKERFEALDTEIAQNKAAYTISNLLFNPNSIDTRWISEENEKSKKAILLYCLRLNNYRYEAESNKTKELENKSRPICELCQKLLDCFYDQDQELANTGDNEMSGINDLIIEELKMNKQQIIEVLKYGNLNEEEFM